MIATTKLRRTITPEDLMPLDEYRNIRREHRRALIVDKAQRRLHVGPHVTLHFENYATMWAQVQEMLYIEKGGEAQIADELDAYNPLIPQGRELVATMLIEIEDEGRRRRTLATLGHIEDKIVLSFGNHRIPACPENDVERTTKGGKTSAVHFLRFMFTDKEAAAFKTDGIQASVKVEHKNYRHGSVLLEDVKSALISDLD